jgi:peptide/nickel transport system permease protein
MSKLVLLAALLLLLIIAFSILAPVISPFDPMQANTQASLSPPNSCNLLGTDLLGRDIFSRLVYGGRQSLMIAMISTLIAATCGLVLGLMATWEFANLNVIAYAIINALLAIPVIVIALVALTVLGQGLYQNAIATGTAYIGACARMTQTSIVGVKRMEFLESAVAVGASQSHILVTHIFPHIIPVFLKYGVVIFSYSLITSAALGFLGLSGEPGIPDWGVMLAEGRNVFTQAPWISLASGGMLTLTVLCINLITDDLR